MFGFSLIFVRKQNMWDSLWGWSLQKSTCKVKHLGLYIVYTYIQQRKYGGEYACGSVVLCSHCRVCPSVPSISPLGAVGCRLGQRRGHANVTLREVEDAILRESRLVHAKGPRLHQFWLFLGARFFNSILSAFGFLHSSQKKSSHGGLKFRWHFKPCKG